jgi:hypothetical protein
LESKSQ